MVLATFQVETVTGRGSNFLGHGFKLLKNHGFICFIYFWQFESVTQVTVSQIPARSCSLFFLRARFVVARAMICFFQKTDPCGIMTFLCACDATKQSKANKS